MESFKYFILKLGFEMLRNAWNICEIQDFIKKKKKIEIEGQY